jgi:hypothetical protein
MLRPSNHLMITSHIPFVLHSRVQVVGERRPRRFDDCVGRAKRSLTLPQQLGKLLLCVERNTPLPPDVPGVRHHHTLITTAVDHFGRTEATYPPTSDYLLSLASQFSYGAMRSGKRSSRSSKKQQQNRSCSIRNNSSLFA